MKRQLFFISILVTLLGIALAAGLSLAQEPQPPEGEVGQEAGAGGTSVEEETGPAVTTLSYVPIQGRLTDAAGNMLNGDYPIVANIYDALSGGTAVCSYDGTVSVSNGLFMINMLCWNQAITGQQLYLGVKVGDDPEMTPRQPINPVPYAITVYPGAVIKGDTSYVFVPSAEFVKNTSDDSTRWTSSGGSTNFYAGSATVGTRHIRLPITIPAVLYGQPVRVTWIRVYYKCQDGANAYISETELYKQTDADSFVSLFDDTTNQQDNTATNYDLATDSALNTLSQSQGIITLRLGLFFNNDSDYVTIGGVRLTVQTTY